MDIDTYVRRSESVATGSGWLLLSFHCRKRRGGGGTIVSRNFRKIVAAVADGQLTDIFHDDSNGKIEVGALRFLIQRRTDLSMLRRLFLGKLGRVFVRPDDSLSGSSRESVLVVDGTGFGDLVPSLAPHFQESVVYHHNFEPNYYRDAFTKPLIRKLFTRAGHRSQKTAFRHDSLQLFMTRRDRDQAISAYGETAGRCEVFGVYEPVAALPRGPAGMNGKLRVLITGSLEGRKGAYGLMETLKIVLGDRTSYESRMKFVVAGRNPSSRLSAMADGKLIELVANPPSMQEIVLGSDVYYNPNFTGSGIKVRNFDGLRCGLPLICRVENAAGFEELRAPALRTFADPKEGLKLLKEINVPEIRSEAHRMKVWRMYKAAFDLDVGTSRLKALLRK